MTIFLYGPDGYRVKQARNSIIDNYRSKYSHGLGVFFIDVAENSGIKELSDSLKNSSLFDEYKLFVLTGSFVHKNSDGIIDIVRESSSAAERGALFLFTEYLSEKELASKNKELFKVLSSGDEIKKFEFLTGAKLIEWIKKETEARGCSVNRRTAEKLAEICGNESWLLVNEIEKLTSFRRRGEVSEADIDLLLLPASEMNIFDLTDAISCGNRRKAFELIYANLSSGKDPFFLMAMITNQIRNLITVQDLIKRNEKPDLIAKRTGLHPFVVKKISRDVSGFGSGDLRNKFDDLQKLDISAKNGLSNMTDSLFNFILK